MKATTFILLFALFALASSSHNVTDDTVFPTLKGDLIETDTTTLNLHIIPHTHDDIGWLKTVDQYYYDSQKEITIQGVQYILDSIFPVLQVDPAKRFMYVEMGFFQRWWNEQDDNMKNIVRQLTNSGQFEFINGGYCMNDEADVYYEDSIDQMTLGHNFLLENLNVIPEVGWHIDPFGHASAQAALFAQMGFKAFFFARIDYQDKANRLANKSMEMIWIPNTSQGIENAMFTHVNYHHYSNPQGFNFDIIASDDPIRDDPTLEEYDVNLRADQYNAWFRQMSQSYLSKDLFHTAGEDFTYMAAGIPFKNNDKLFKYIRNNPSYNLNVSYSTPTEYLDAIYPQNLQYPYKSDDFFPYADGDNAYWTGYFTSRVSVKGLVREQGRLLQAARRLATQALWEQTSQFVQNNFAQVDQAIYKLEEAMAIGQHHDAVTGTEKQAVAEDYKLHYAVGNNAIKQNFLYPFFQEKVQEDLGFNGAQFQTCNVNTTASACNVTAANLLKGTSVLVAIYNSGQQRNSTIRIKVPTGLVQVTTTNGVNVPTDVICSNATDSSDCDLFFTASFNSFDISYYYLTPSTTSNLVASQTVISGTAYTINENQTITVAQNKSGYTLNYCEDPSHSSCYTTNFNLNYNYYESYTGNDQQSGAYIFRPSTKTLKGSIPYATPVYSNIYVGKNLIQIHVNSKIILTDIRIYNDIANGIEVQTFIDSIPIADNVGKEVIMQVQVPSIHNANFYTDSMGMELQERVLNYRPTWKLNVTQPVSGNYYPIQAIITINDTKTNESFSIIPDRAQGGTSLSQGEIELMIHRRVLHDDARGVGEPLNETDWDGSSGLRQWVTHTFLFAKHKVLKTHPRLTQLDRDTDNIILLAPMPKLTYLEMPERLLGDDSFMVFDPQAKLIARPLANNKFLMRFQNMDDETFIMVSTNSFTSNKLGKGTPVEMSLTGNQAKADMIRKRFNWNGLQLNNPSFANTDYLDTSLFLLRPLEIRTFIVSFSGNDHEELISI